jgi:hypothetical protein
MDKIHTDFEGKPIPTKKTERDQARYLQQMKASHRKRGKGEPNREGLIRILDDLNEHQIAFDNAREKIAMSKSYLCQYAIDNNLIDCLTVNIAKLERHAAS